MYTAVACAVCSQPGPGSARRLRTGPNIAHSAGRASECCSGAARAGHNRAWWCRHKGVAKLGVLASRICAGQVAVYS